MSDNPKKKINRNASPSAYGWAFQVGAGIKLMLDHVKEFECLKMEGKYDDIEITLSGNKKIYAQAKSVTQMGDQSTANVNLKKSLEVLDADSENEDSAQLIYITNILNPLSTSSKLSPFYDKYDKIYDYSVLPATDQQKIIDLVGSDFPLEQFQIHVLRFFGKDEEKFDGIKEAIEKFLQEALGETSHIHNLWPKWYTLFSLNCTDKPKEEMSFDKTKKEILQPVIVLAIDPPVEREEFQEVSDYDDYGEIKKQYLNLINNCAYDYEFSTPVLGAYHLGKGKADRGDRAKYKYKFVSDKWKEYEKYFSEISNDDVREAVTKMTLLTIIVRSDKLESIRKAINS